jgi:hypothetical protein
VLAIAASAARPLHADGVELVDEDDRRRVVPRLLEELPDPGGAESGEHLDEGRGALRVEARARFVGDRLRKQRLAGAGRTVEEDALRDPRAEPLEALGIAQEIDDLSELVLRLVETRDLLPGDRAAGARLDHGGLHPRHQLQAAPEQIDDQREHDDGKPHEGNVPRHAQHLHHVERHGPPIGSRPQGLKRT